MGDLVTLFLSVTLCHSDTLFQQCFVHPVLLSLSFVLSTFSLELPLNIFFLYVILL